MPGDVIINTDVNTDEVLELEDKQHKLQAVCLVCSTTLPNHIALSVLDYQRSIDIEHGLIYTKEFCAQTVILLANHWDGIPT